MRDNSLAISIFPPFKLEFCSVGCGHPFIVEIHNIAVRTVINHQWNNPAFAVFEFLRELQNISDGGSSEAIKALIIVSNHTDILTISSEKKDKLLLNIICILILIDHNVSDLCA